MAEEKKTEHKKIKVAKVNPPRKVGDRYEVVEFKGEDNVLYEVWSKTLVAELKEGIEIEVDIVHTVNETDRGTFHHHKITQIYKGGEPVKAKGRGQYGKSPEELELSRRSFALSYAKDLVVANKLSPENLLTKADEFYNWLGPQTREVGAIVPIKIKVIEPAQGTLEDTGKEVQGDKIVVSNAKELMAWAQSHDKKYTPTWVRKQANIQANEIITDEMAVTAYQTIKTLMNWED